MKECYTLGSWNLSDLCQSHKSCLPTGLTATRRNVGHQSSRKFPWQTLALGKQHRFLQDPTSRRPWKLCQTGSQHPPTYTPFSIPFCNFCSDKLYLWALAQAIKSDNLLDTQIISHFYRPMSFQVSWEEKRGGKERRGGGKRRVREEKGNISRKKGR